MYATTIYNETKERLSPKTKLKGKDSKSKLASNIGTNMQSIQQLNLDVTLTGTKSKHGSPENSRPNSAEPDKVDMNQASQSLSGSKKKFALSKKNTAANFMQTSTRNMPQIDFKIPYVEKRALKVNTNSRSKLSVI